MSVSNSLATTLSKVLSAGARPQAELSFSLMQNTYIRRLNSEIQKVNDVRGDVALEAKLIRDNKKLTMQVASVQQFTFDNQSNLGKLTELAAQVADLSSIFGSDGDALDVTAQEVTDFIAKRDEVVAKINSLYVVNHPDVANFGRIKDLLDQVDALSAFTPDVGAVDPEGTASPNNNRQIADFLNELTNKTSVAMTVTEETVYLGNQMFTTYQQKIYSNDADLLSMTQVQQADRAKEIEDLKIQYANLLKAVSISQEVNLSMTEGFANKLNGNNLPESGSVMNLFA